MEIYEKFMEINGHSWKFQKKYGNSTKFLEIDGNSWKVYGNLKKFMEIEGNSLKFKESYEN